MISVPMVPSVRTVHLSCVKISTISKRTEISFHLISSHRSTIGCVQNDFWTYGTFGANHAPILCQDYTIFKWAKMSYHLSFVTLEYHWVHPKWFLSLWYVWHKQCTYLALILTLYPNRPKRDSTWASSPRSTIGCMQNDFWAYGTFGTDRAHILHKY